MLSTSKLILPEPTYTPPDPSKKSHARRQPPGHVSRPRNAFILFRCDFVRQKKIPQSVEKDHRNISRIVGSIWRGMSAQEREPWVKMADEEKANHMKAHPGYRFTRGSPNSTRRTKRGDEASPVQEDLASLSSNEALLALDRAIPCSVGAPYMPTVNLEFLHDCGNPMKIRDGLKRRPSHSTLYQSTSNDLKAEAGPEFFADIMNQHNYAEAVKERQEVIQNAHENVAKEIPEKEASNEAKDPEGICCGPRLNPPQYPIPATNHFLFPWEESSQASIPWADSSLEAPVNDVNGYISQDPVPEFTDPFLSTLPPLPRCSLPYPSEGDQRTNFLSERKTSSFFSPRSGTWKLPPPIPNPSVVPANLDSSFANNRHSSSRKSFDTAQDTSAATKRARDVAEEVIQEFSREWLGDMTIMEDEA